ncbi:hypothetical protein SAMN05216464_113104 [Mucilaginibacter pineti]|uniref:Uncharacterized protein n=1 Tax=Mucilaginibacter pineti TaxID=1391627 RepID=A0A1G7IP53_9SPHI|nr:hypothetical protein [Mucilaginibacter pineti]SDF14395.1 hypothetical protein SAMN05216464_113104 [Mucilaginibacter pineti]
MENQSAEITANQQPKITGQTNAPKQTPAAPKVAQPSENPEVQVAENQTQPVAAVQQPQKANLPLKQLDLYDEAMLAMAEGRGPVLDVIKPTVSQDSKATVDTPAMQTTVAESPTPKKSEEISGISATKMVRNAGKKKLGGQSETRITAEMAIIDGRAYRLAKVFAKRVSPETLERLQTREKINGYKDVLSRYRGTSDLTERGQLRGIAMEKKELEEAFYGKGFRFRKLFETIGNRFTNMKENIAPVVKDVTRAKPGHKNNTVSHQLISSGFVKFLIKVDQRINRGHYEFKMNDSKDLGNGKSVDYTLVFGPGKNRHEKTSLQKVEASYTDLKNPAESRTRTFDCRKGINYTKEQMATLISGGGVYLENTKRLGINTGPKWAKMDFNDVRDGEYRINTSRAEDLSFYERRVAALPGFKVYQPGKEKEMTDGLLDGKKVTASLNINGKKTSTILQLDSRTDNISITDNQGKSLCQNGNGKIIDINSRKEVPQQNVTPGKQRKTRLKA